MGHVHRRLHVPYSVCDARNKKVMVHTQRTLGEREPEVNDDSDDTAHSRPQMDAKELDNLRKLVEHDVTHGAITGSHLGKPNNSKRNEQNDEDEDEYEDEDDDDDDDAGETESSLRSGVISLPLQS